MRALRLFHTTRAAASHFDTRRFVVDLQHSGFSKAQSEGIVTIVAAALADGVGSIQGNLVSKETLNRMTYQHKVDFTKLRGELQTTDKSEFSAIQHDTEKLKLELERMKTRLREEITKANAGVRLDLNLEKGRIREEGAQHELHISDIDTRIDQEVANMKMQIDAVKTQVMQWLIGVCTGTFALVLAYVRLLT